MDRRAAGCDRIVLVIGHRAELVREAIARTGASDAKQVGRVMGEIMKANKGRFDASLVKRLLEEELVPKT